MTTPKHVSGTIRPDALIEAAWQEAMKAMRKFPQPNYVISKVAEEAGEVVKAAIHCAEGRETPEAVAGEIKQAMAMLMRLYVEGDQVHGLAPLAAIQPDSEPQPVAWRCTACRNVGYLHCSDPENCGGMKQLTELDG